MIFRVLEPGLLTTVQAAPRRGWQHFGVSGGGPMDRFSHHLANRLLRNGEDAATLEITLMGPRLLAMTDVLVVLTGADLSPCVDGAPVPMGCPLRIAKGATLTFGEARTGCRTYLGVHGGISVPKRMGSRATDLKAGFGGHQGRALKAGDALYRGAGMDPFPEWTLPPDAPFVSRPQEVAYVPDVQRPARLRLVPGTHVDLLTVEGRMALEQGTFTLQARSDRQGLRLAGPPLPLVRPVELLTEGVAFGTLQLPPDGQPILLMADRQSTGGYPRLGEVYGVDLPKAAQLRPGEALQFIVGSLSEARSLAWGATGCT